jgi:hypothetical protein
VKGLEGKWDYRLTDDETSFGCFGLEKFAFLERTLDDGKVLFICIA